MTWLALNVADFEPVVWSDIAVHAKELGIAVLPWGRCWNRDGLERLLDIATVRGSFVIANLEKELEGDLPAEVAAGVMDDYPELEIAISTEGWLYESVDWAAFGNRPVLLQLFPTDMKRSRDELPRLQADCVRHARESGFVHVGVTYQTYGDASPDWYSFYEGVRSYYTGDDIGDEWAAWSV